MKTIVVTGATGFIGSHLVNKLKKNKKIRVKLLDRKKHFLNDPKSLKNLLKNCDVLYHLAGISDPNSEDLFKVNVMGAANLMSELIKSAPRAKVVYASSFSVYNTPIKGEVINENFPAHPRNANGISRLMVEQLLEYFFRQYGLAINILRISNVYGPGILPYKHSVVANFIDLAKKSLSLTIDGDGTQTRDFIFVGDVVDALIKAGNHWKNFQIINICSGEEISLRKLVDILSQLTKKQLNVQYRKKNRSSGGFWKGQNAKAKKLLNWKPKTSFAKGIRYTWREV